MGKDRTSLEEQKQVQDKEETKEPSLFKVLLHNDDYTTMDFVIMILETVFNKDATEATRIMLNIHNQGVGIAGVYTREIGETKISVVHDMAKKYQFPLKCSLEKVNP
jgi:ATP-dependent Clp protease adaptor protein ClpS